MILYTAAQDICAAMQQPASLSTKAATQVVHHFIMPQFTKSVMSAEDIAKCPYTMDTPEGTQLKCWECGKGTCTSFNKLLNHMKVYHGAKEQLWQHNVVWMKGRKASGRNDAKGSCEGDGEHEQQQSQMSRELHLSIAASHLLKFPDGLDKETCKVAAAVLLQCAAQQAGGQVQACQVQQPLPQPLQHEQSSGVNQEQSNVPKQKTLLNVPSLKPHTMCAAWGLPANWDRYERHSFPIKKKVLPELDEDFKKYLLKLRNGSISASVLGARRFLALLSFEKPDGLGGHSLLEVMLGCYRSGTMDEILNSELMSPGRTWSRPLTTSLNHMMDHLKIICGRQKLIEEKHEVDQMVIETLKLHTRHETKAKKKENGIKKRKDAARLKLIAPTKKIKKAVRKAMKKLQALVGMARAAGHTTPEIRAACNTLLVGIIFHNGFAGRSGEWETILMKDVHRCLNIENLEYIICTEHKTAQYYGDLSKYLFPGTIAAIRCYLELPGDEDGLLLKPASASAAKVSIAHCLRSFNNMLLSRWQPTKVNLLRKHFHTVLNKQACLGKVFGLLRKVDAHSCQVAKDIYTTSTPEDDAELGKHLFEEVFGSAVEWPELDDSIIDSTDILEAMQKLEHIEPGVHEDEPEDLFTIAITAAPILALQKDDNSFDIQQLQDAVVSDCDFACDDEECGEVGGEEESLAEASDIEANIKGEPPSDEDAGDASNVGSHHKRSIETVSACSAEARPKRGRTSRFSQLKKDWLIEKTLEYNAGKMLQLGQHPNPVVIETIIKEGKALGIISAEPNVTEKQLYDSVRHVMRMHRPAKFPSSSS